jgi:hypothetical protein
MSLAVLDVDLISRNSVAGNSAKKTATSDPYCLHACVRCGDCARQRVCYDYGLRD